MNKELFITIYDALYSYNENCKELYKLGIDLTKHDLYLYNLTIDLILTHINKEQLDFLLWCIFSDDPKQLNIISSEDAYNKYIELWNQQ